METIFVVTGATNKLIKVLATERAVCLWAKNEGWYVSAQVGKNVHYHFAGGRFAGMITPWVVDGVDALNLAQRVLLI